MLTVAKKLSQQSILEFNNKANAYMSINEQISQHNNIINFRQNKFINNTKINKKEREEIIISKNHTSKFIKTTNFEKWNNGSYDLWEIGFKLIDASEDKYSKIHSIEVLLYKNEEIIARRSTVKGGVYELMKDDIFYGGLDGTLSCSFKERNIEETTRYWKSTPFDFTTPDKAEIRISVIEDDKNQISLYIADINNPASYRHKLVCIK